MSPKPDKNEEQDDDPDLDIEETFESQGAAPDAKATDRSDKTELGAKTRAGFEEQTQVSFDDEPEASLDEPGGNATIQHATGVEDVLPDPEIVVDETYATEGDPDRTTDSNHTAQSRDRATFNFAEATMASRGMIEEQASSDDFSVDETQSREGLPEKIGRYEVHRLLGEGAFGRVYEARDPQLDRQVAVKVAKSISRRSQVQRFLREARAAAKLRHPNIIPVYEYGQVDDENIIIYEFVAGETLKSYIKRHEKIELSETTRIVREIAEGLDYAHRQGIIHRDMKPDNVLIDANGKPHIADFGCARSIDDETNLTIDGSILGTPMYMSPEQAGGKSHAADGRTDIWSLGVMLYEMVSGQRPFFGKMSDLLFWICNNDAKALRKVFPETPVEIETICSKCLTRELDGRFATAKDLADELARFERGEPILSRRTSTLKRTWMWAKRNRAVASLLATVAFTLVAGSIVSTVFGIKANREQVKFQNEQKNRAVAQLTAISSAEAASLNKLFEDLKPYRDTLQARLEDRSANVDATDLEKRRCRLAIARLSEEVLSAKQTDQLVKDLLAGDVDDFFLFRDVVWEKSAELTETKETLWGIAQDYESTNRLRRFKAAAALASFDHESEHWERISDDVVSQLMQMNQVVSAKWLPAFGPVREKLRTELIDAFLSRGENSQRLAANAAAAVASLFEGESTLLVELVQDASYSQLPVLTSALKSEASSAGELVLELELLNRSEGPPGELASKKANVVVAQLQLGNKEPLKMLGGLKDLSVASELIEQIGPSETPIETFDDLLGNWKQADPEVLSGALLAIGEYRDDQLVGKAQRIVRFASEIFADHPSARAHSCARWLLVRLGKENQVIEMEKGFRRPLPEPSKNWHVDLAGNTLAIIDPVKFQMGLEPGESKGEFETLDEPFHTKQIPRRFGIGIYEVTIAQFEEFEADFINLLESKIEILNSEIVELSAQITDGAETLDDELAIKLKLTNRASKQLSLKIRDIGRVQTRREGVEKNLPVGDVDFFMTLAFCRWSCDKNKTDCGLPTMDQFINAFQGGVDYAIGHEELSKAGYRLPTASEWEYACRGESETVFPFGQDPRLARHYAWFATNSDSKLQPVGQLKPGVNGLFDVLGNVSEWCLDWYSEELPSLEGQNRKFYVDFGPEFTEGRQALDREYRGGSYADEIFDVRSSRRFATRPIKGFPRLGFRLARTYESDSEPDGN